MDSPPKTASHVEHEALAQGQIDRARRIARDALDAALSADFAQSAEHCWVESNSGAFHWNDQDRFLESYIEAGLPLFDPISVITDGFETAADDHMKLDAASPSRPMDTFSIHGFVFTDQPFVDIDLTCQ